MSILSRQAIQQLGLIQNADVNRFRDIGYDLSVGAIYVPEDDERNLGSSVVNSHEIPSHGVVMIFSRETVDVPQGVCGYAMPKTSLCEEGILVLNTGIVDPTYRGPISGTAINFRKTAYRMNEGDAFLRLVFEEVSSNTPQRAQAEIPFTPHQVQAYRNERMVRAQQYGASFLNIRPMIRTVAETITHNMIDRDRRFFGYTIAAAALVFAVLQVIPSIIPRFTFSEEALEARVVQRLRGVDSVGVDSLRSQLDAQRTLIEHLQRRLDEQQSASSSGPRVLKRQ